MSTKPHTAPPPFNYDDADITIRTSDRVDFHVHKLILSKASHIFSEMFDLALSSAFSTAKQCDEGDIPFVDVVEHSDIWDRLLRICYPVPPPTLDNLDYVLPLVETARKYQMEGVREYVGQVLLAYHALSADTLRLYILACYSRNDDVARLTAKAMLGSWRSYSLPGPYAQELQSVTGGALYRLLEYRQKCGEVASALTDASAWHWMIPHRSSILFSCLNCTRSPGTWVGTYNLSPSTYLQNYLKRAGVALKVEPCGVTVTAVSMVGPALRAAYKCKICTDRVLADMTRVAETFAAEVERVISKARSCLR
ncbi:hypothetical protein AcV5_009866 [Taiwanofungus camphoratus]|nr:hypothetical protein AcV5_009866 [Antrodia cinnamomea]